MQSWFIVNVGKVSDLYSVLLFYIHLKCKYKYLGISKWTSWGDRREIFKIRKNILIMFLEKKKNIKNYISDYIRYKSVELVWPRAKNGWRKAPSENFGMCPPGRRRRRRRGRPRNSWMQEVTTGMRERGIVDL